MPSKARSYPNLKETATTLVRCTNEIFVKFEKKLLARRGLLTDKVLKIHFTNQITTYLVFDSLQRLRISSKHMSLNIGLNSKSLSSIWNGNKYIREVTSGNLSLTNIYLFNVSNRNTRKRCQLSSKLIIKTPERLQWRRSGVFMFDFEHI